MIPWGQIGFSMMTYYAMGYYGDPMGNQKRSSYVGAMNRGVLFVPQCCDAFFRLSGRTTLTSRTSGSSIIRPSQ